MGLRVCKNPAIITFGVKEGSGMDLDKARRSRDGVLLGDWDVPRCPHNITHGTDGTVCPLCHRAEQAKLEKEQEELKAKIRAEKAAKAKAEAKPKKKEKKEEKPEPKKEEE